MLQTISLINTTVSTLEQAHALARHLVEARSSGCVQIEGPIQSVYRWEGKICDQQEYRLSCKTLPRNVESVLELIRELHSYEVPELVVSTLDCSGDYYLWLSEQVAPESPSQDS